MRWQVYSLFILISLISCKKDYSHLETKVLGHAGESIHDNKSDYPPNTLESIKRAFELGADGVEVDVQMTNDLVLVAWHDPTLDENSSGSGCVSNINYSQVSSVEVYNSEYKINLLSDVVDYVLNQNKEIMLDVKHYNLCSDSFIDYAQFDQQINQLLSVYSNEQKKLITINSTSESLLQSLSDTIVNRSLESDDPTSAIQTAIEYNFDMLTIKLDKLDQTHRDQMSQNNIELSIFNVKSRGDIKKALQYAPDFVISDNIPCTTKALHGK